MANRETYPASQSPLNGDISGAAGATQVTVVGWQGNPIQAGPLVDQNIYRYNFNDAEWELKLETACILVNGDPTSDDFIIFVNATFVKVNGVIVAP
jgi:hypothetical protein